MIRSFLSVIAALQLIGCASSPKAEPPPAIVVSSPVYTVFYEIPAPLFDCPDVLDQLVLPVPDGEGRYSVTEVDTVIANLYGHSSQCSTNMAGIKDTYNSAKKKYDNGGGVE